jgi:hypothetical protein
MDTLLVSAIRKADEWNKKGVWPFDPILFS